MKFQVKTIGNATLYCGDALSIMQSLNQVDALITDPPYSSGGFTRGDRMKGTREKYMTSSTSRLHDDFSGDNRDVRSFSYWLTLILSSAHRLVVPGGYAMIFTDWRQLPTCTDVFQAAGFIWRGIVPWDKTQSSRAPHTGYFRHQAEYVIWGSNGSLGKRNGVGPFPGVIQERVNPKHKLHQTGKPINLMSSLIRAVPDNSTILDPFMGSASTGIAALQSGHKFIGIELNPAYYDVACNRINQFYDELSS